MPFTTSARLACACLVALAVVALAAPASRAAEDPIPADKQTTWERLKVTLSQQLAVCYEHCGASPECKKRCDDYTAYRTKVERAQLLTTVPDAKLKAGTTEDQGAYPSCLVCGMDRKEFAHARVAVEYPDGRVFPACSLRCALMDLIVNIGLPPKAVMVGDYDTKKLIDARTAVWVIGGEKPGVMARTATWAFADMAAAEKFRAANGGEIGSFHDALQAAGATLVEQVEMTLSRKAQ